MGLLKGVVGALCDKEDGSGQLENRPEDLFLGVPGADLGIASKLPSVIPPSGFNWQFITGLWSFVPSVASVITSVPKPVPKPMLPNVTGLDPICTSGDTDVDHSMDHSLGGSASGGDLPEVDFEHNKSESKFEKAIRSLMPGLSSEIVEEQ